MNRLRHWINLVESSIAWLDDDPELVLRHIEAWDHREELGDGYAKSKLYLSTADIQRIQNKLKPLITDGSMTLYRAMQMGSFAIKRITAGDRLGYCWTSSLGTAIPFNTKNFDLRRHYVFAGKTPVNSVDWLSAIALYDNGENEVRLIYNAPLTLIWIKDSYSNEIRPDLWGEDFKA